MKNAARLFVAAATVAVLVGCGGGSAERTVPEAEAAAENSAVFGDYRVFFHAISTDEVPPDVARAVGVVRARNRGMLNVSVQRLEDSASVEAEVRVDAANLTGQQKSITMRKVEQGDAIYYLGELSIKNRETIIFDISVTPVGSDDTFEVRTKRIYHTD